MVTYISVLYIQQLTFCYVCFMFMFSGPFEIELQTAWHLTSKYLYMHLKIKVFFFIVTVLLSCLRKSAVIFLMTSYMHSTIRLFQLYTRCIL